LLPARELFKQPNLLLLDEATSDLDTASERPRSTRSLHSQRIRDSCRNARSLSLTAQHIQDSIDALKGEVTVVIIAHRLSTVKNADRVYVLDE
jgi:ABC-type multidrug transport system fused ATPase/permease subunit